MAKSLNACVLVLGMLMAIFAPACGDRKSMEEEQIKVSEFDVKPGAGRQEHEEKWDDQDDYTCKFTYMAQGGTKEQWVMGITRSSDLREYACIVERPGGKSYLFFEEFKMEVIAPGLILKEVDVEKEPGVRLQNKEYIIVKDTNTVMQWDGKFDSQLSKLEVYATRGKGEL